MPATTPKHQGRHWQPHTGFHSREGRKGGDDQACALDQKAISLPGKVGVIKDGRNEKSLKILKKKN